MITTESTSIIIGCVHVLSSSIDGSKLTMQGHIHKALFCAVFVLYLIPDAEVESKIIRYFPQRLRLNDTHEDHAAALPARKCPYHCKLNITDTVSVAVKCSSDNWLSVITVKTTRLCFQKWCPLHCRPYKRMSAG